MRTRTGGVLSQAAWLFRHRFGYAGFFSKEGLELVEIGSKYGFIDKSSKRGRKRSTVRQPLAEPVAANQAWALDFMSDALSTGRRFRILKIVDDYKRECLAIEVDTSLRSACGEGAGRAEEQTRTAAADPL